MAELMALLIATLGALLGTGASDKVLAAQVAKAVQDKPPVPIESVAVECKGAAAQGVDEIGFTLDGLLLDPLLIKEAQINVGKVKRAADKKVSIGSIAWTADIEDGELTKALQSHVDKLNDATVTIAPEGITLSGSYPMWPFPIPYTVTGDLVVENKTQLMFHITKSGVSGMKMPGGLNKLIEKEINPVYDLAKFAARSKKDIERAKQQLNYDFNLLVDKLTPAEGHIIVTGTA
jgi:hypothetical protein